MLRLYKMVNNTDAMMKTLVVGLGNPYLTDDGVGVKVAYEVEKHLVDCPRLGVDVTEASVGGLRLMELLIGYDRAIIVDAFLGNGSAPHGAVHRLNLDDLRQARTTEHSTSAHDTSLITALDFGFMMGFHLPQEISIYAVEVENVMDFNEQTTPAVAAAIPTVTALILAELGVEL